MKTDLDMFRTLDEQGTDFEPKEDPAGRMTPLHTEYVKLVVRSVSFQCTLSGT